VGDGQRKGGRDTGIRRLVLWIALAVGLPTLIWFLTAGYLAWERHQLLVQMQETGRLTAIASEAQGVVHALQLERDLSIAVLAGREVRLLFRELGQARPQADQAIGRLHDRLQATPGLADSQSLHACRLAIESLAGDVDLLRGQVNGRELRPRDAATAWGGRIDGLSSCLLPIEEISEEAAVTRLVRALHSFATYKDFAGLERAFGAGVMTSDVPNPLYYQYFSRYSEIQAPYLERLLAQPDTGLPGLLEEMGYAGPGSALAASRERMPGLQWAGSESGQVLAVVDPA
jgi:hypothetical protein